MTSERETAIRDVAAGVAAPALAGFVLWTQEQSRLRGLRRLRFVSRDGRVLHELTRRLAPVLGAELDRSTLLQQLSPGIRDSIERIGQTAEE